jgi:hypothetical protein
LPAAFDFASAFFFAAHRCRILSAAAALCAAVNLRRPFFAGAGAAFSVVGAAAGSATASGFFGGRPRRFPVTVPPESAAIARFNLSLSEIKRARIYSVIIDRIVTWETSHIDVVAQQGLGVGIHSCGDWDCSVEYL